MFSKNKPKIQMTVKSLTIPAFNFIKNRQSNPVQRVRKPQHISNKKFAWSSLLFNFWGDQSNFLLEVFSNSQLFHLTIFIIFKLNKSTGPAT